MKRILMTLTVVCMMGFLLVGCGNDEEKEAQENEQPTESQQHQDEENTENSTDDSDDSITEDDEATPEEEQQEDSTDSESENDANETAEGEKEEYLALLQQTKEETDEMREHPRDDTTYAMKEVEGNLYVIWDGLLNDIYEDLEEQLSPEEMDELRDEQRAWLEYRDETAKDASLKYEGGTAEQLEYVMVENNLTIDRCFELVEDYFVE